MCGICGSFVYQGTPASDLPALRTMRDSMAARGPDGCGEWSTPGGRLWLGHRRLAIIDLSERGAQPMLSADGTIAITFNGEIYNHLELRKALEAKGHTFRGHSDTEVIIEAYRSKGADCVSDLRGMFAFALWDESRQSLLLARDPYGIKPLYYSAQAGRLIFASTVKALLQSGAVSRAPDPAGLAGFYVFGSVPEPWTVYSAISSVPAGSTILIDQRGVQSPRRFWSISQTIAGAEAQAACNGSSTLQADATAMRDALLDSVRHHLVSDVPVGAFLSAGVDSSSLVGLMRDAGHHDIQSITLTYAEFAGSDRDEAPLAQDVARYYGTKHATRTVGAEEFHADLPKIMAAMDQPSVDGINTWFVAKAAREQGLKVAISGAGGDELVGGYSTFKTVPKLARLLSAPAKIAGLAALLSTAVGAARGAGLGLHPKHAGLLRYGGTMAGAYLLQRGLFLPTELRSLLADPEFFGEGLRQLDPLGLLTAAIANGPQTSMGQIAALESSFYLRNQLLRDADWAGMAHSLEIRTPLVDHVLLGRVGPLMMRTNPPNGKALQAAAPKKPVPDFIASRKKTGFGIPLERWMELAADAPANREEPFSRRWARRVAKWQLPGGSRSEDTGRPAVTPEPASSTVR